MRGVVKYRQTQKNNKKQNKTKTQTQNKTKKNSNQQTQIGQITLTICIYLTQLHVYAVIMQRAHASSQAR